MIDPLSLPPVTEQDREPAAGDKADLRRLLSTADHATCLKPAGSPDGLRRVCCERTCEADAPRPHLPNAELLPQAWEAFDAEGAGGELIAPRSATAARWTISIEGWEPVRVNQLLGCHWAVAAKRKKSVTRAIRSFAPHVPRATTKRRVTLKITLAPRMRADPDCYWKTVLDSLVHLGLLVDDSARWVELAPVEFVRAAAKSTTITLEDIDS